MISSSVMMDLWTLSSLLLSEDTDSFSIETVIAKSLISYLSPSPSNGRKYFLFLFWSSNLISK